MRHNFLLMLAVSSGVAIAQQPITTSIQTVPGMPPVISNTNLYSETAAGKMSPSVASALTRVYVPNRQSNDVYVIDPETMKVVDKFRVGLNPQHVAIVGFEDLVGRQQRRRTTKGTLTPIDPATGKPGKSIVVDDPYNMYFTPDGASRSSSPKRVNDSTSAMRRQCKCKARCQCPIAAASITLDFSIDGRYAIFTCEFIMLGQGRHGQPQSHRLSEVVQRRNAARHPCVSGWKTFLCGRHARRRRPRHRRRKFAEAEFIKTESARMACIPTATAPSCTWPTAARTRYMVRAGKEGSVSVIDFATAKSKRRGRFRVAAVPTWATSAPTVRRCGYQGDSMMSSTQSTPQPARSRKFQGKEPHG